MNYNPWESFDDIICINLRYRTDRYAWAKSIFQRLKIPARFAIVEKSPHGGVYGCFESHINIIKECYEKGCKTIMIFEDDIIPTPGYSLKHVQNGIDFMRTHPSWDLFYFGYFAVNDNSDLIFKAHSTHNKHIVRYSPTATHAYCLNRRSMKKILDTYHPIIGREHLDVYYSSREMKLENYCYVPMIFEQTECVSADNPARDEREYNVRAMGCILEHVKFHYNMSLVTFMYQHYITLSFAILSIAVVIMCFYVHVKNKKE